MATLSFDELRARALGVIDAIDKESPGVDVFVVLVSPAGDGEMRFAAESSLDQTGAAELLRIVSSTWRHRA